MEFYFNFYSGPFLFTTLWDMVFYNAGSSADIAKNLSKFQINERLEVFPMFKKVVNKVLPVFTLALVMIADAATSTSTLIHHGEPDCPEELMK